MNKKTNKKIGVIDIGSNSVRLVIYDSLKRVPLLVFNEKILCGLARDIDKTGFLFKEGVTKSLSAIGRYTNLLKIMQIKSFHLFATAAVRDAKDGKRFIEKIYRITGQEVKVFSGEDEAFYAGCGAISGIPDADGVVGDLGGGSLELISVRNGKLDTKSSSYPIGALRLVGSKRKLDNIVNSCLEEYELEKYLAGRSFYAIGGAFRNLAKIHISRKGYNLKVLHNYKIKADDFAVTLQIVEKMSDKSLSKITGVSKKRLDVLPVAARIASLILKKGKPEYVIFSVYGVREGFLYSKLSEKIKKRDPLIEGCHDLSSGISETFDYGYELADWMKPLFENEGKVKQRLRLAACLLSEISRYDNTEYRGELAYKRVIDSTLSGIDHKDRVYIALSLYYRYRINIEDEIEKSVNLMLSKDEILEAKKIGYAMKLARCLSGSCENILQHTKIKTGKKKLKLVLSKETALLNGEQVEKRLGLLAALIDLAPSIKVKS